MTSVLDRRLVLISASDGCGFIMDGASLSLRFEEKKTKARDALKHSL